MEMEKDKPKLDDVAKFVSATVTSVPSPESVRMFYYLVEHIEPLRELWARLNDVLPGGDSLRRVVELLVCLDHEVTSESAYGTAVWLLEQAEETAMLWKRLEAMGADAGRSSQYPTYPMDVVEWHRAVNRLVANDRWTTADQVLDPLGEMGIEYKELIEILDARLDRKEGDVERLKVVRRWLLKEAAASRKKPRLVRVVEEP